VTIFFITFSILILAFAGMAIGVLLGRPAIKGSCGGLNQVGLAGSCSGACSVQEKEECALKKAAIEQEQK
jgi:hypothetical protein